MYQLGLAMIVRNEGHIIRRCLKSVMPVIDYWVIIDTGSTDTTISLINEILADIPGQLIQKPWVDFATNRNQYIEAARGKVDYILVMDADQVLEMSGFSKAQLREKIYNCTVIYDVMQHSFPKVFRPDCGCFYEGVIHNYMKNNGNSIHNLNSLVFRDRHDGIRASDYKKKLKEDIVVLERSIVEDADNAARYTFYLAQSLREDRQYEKSIKYYDKRARMGGWKEECWYSFYQIGNCYLGLKDFDSAILSYMKAYNYRPSRVEPVYRLCAIYRELGQRRLHYEFAKIGMNVAFPDDVLFVEYQLYDYLILFEYSVSLYWVAQYEEAIKTCDLLDGKSSLPADIRKQNRKNRQLSVEKLRLQ